VQPRVRVFLVILTVAAKYDRITCGSRPFYALNRTTGHMFLHHITTQYRTIEVLAKSRY